MTPWPEPAASTGLVAGDTVGSLTEEIGPDVPRRYQARWHNRRSEAFVTRAVALLGFVGVVLALLLQGADLGGIEPTGWTWTLLITTLVALLVVAAQADGAPSSPSSAL